MILKYTNIICQTFQGIVELTQHFDRLFIVLLPTRNGSDGILLSSPQSSAYEAV